MIRVDAHGIQHIKGAALSLEHPPGRNSDLDSIRIVRDHEMPETIGTSSSSWQRMKRQGDTPAVTWLSERQRGYRVSDIRVWLDKKRAEVA
jgi:predicted DNA-binding transcriptional regulator AlpA